MDYSISANLGNSREAMYSGTSLILAPMGQKKVSLFSEVSSFQRLKCMQEWYLGWEKVREVHVLSSGVSS